MMLGNLGKEEVRFNFRASQFAPLPPRQGLKRTFGLAVLRILRAAPGDMDSRLPT